MLTGAFLGIAGYSVARLVAAERFPGGYPGCHRATDAGHAVMALGMAVMCSPVGGPLPMAGWQTVFVLVTAWFLGSSFLGSAVRSGQRPVGWHGADWQHAVAGLGMLYMLTATPHTAHGMSSSWTVPHAGQASLPLLGWAFVAFFLVQAARLSPLVLRRTGSGILADGRVAATCQLVMALGTGYLIFLML
ncbi:DUF5134 domain-containing protein [Actinokineospora sp. NBRC 105648]|uniref:DUF5134 domain-containing protein n=1 Tax=Actinokineospora sp. NBRC 105648 TaxID=3032206 RepID=UPI0024A5855B|nr:DUF5134 domain-containing protein [Actinokineospora sp. NBRC 105648]GLZ38341.1 DUF5134 domain-containing protein [Actinokineospora sp. NBRC 105648]